jgi:hypothetical protein
MELGRRVAVTLWAAAALVGAVCPPVSAEEKRSVDILAYCRHTYGGAAAYTHVRTDIYSWRCTNGGRQYSVDMDAVCATQHGAAYKAVVDNPTDDFSWHCIPK